MPFRTATLHFNGGDSVDVRDADIVVLVGPNNTGKSRTLAEISSLISTHPGHPDPINFVLRSANIEAQQTDEEVAEWLRQNRYSWTEPSDGHERIRTFNAGEVMDYQIGQLWANAGTGRLGQLGHHLVRGLWCGERLGYLGSPTRPDPMAHPEHPVQWLVQDPAKLDTFRRAFATAFNSNVIVDAWGNSIRLRVDPNHVQDDFTSSTSDGLPDPEVMRRLAQIPLIEEQSDGVRSFAGIVMTLLTMPYPVILLDEPEAFLHPPQARLLGRYLSDLQREGQLFVATHSLDILLGLVQSRPERVLIIRLTREGGRTFAQTLPPEDLARLWRDPLLRFSRALDGIFHDGVVVCEGDTDSQFYSAVSDVLPTDPRDVMFTYAGSKHRIPLITNALRALDVPVRAVVDFDALNDEHTLKSLVEGAGGIFSDDMKRLRGIVDAHLRGGTIVPSVKAALSDITEVLTGEGPVTSGQVAAVREALEPETGWRAAKRSGAAVVPPGDSTVALQELMASLASAGVFVVPSGAVESFARAVPGKGPRWVVEVVEGGHLATAMEAQGFVTEVLRSFQLMPDASAA